MSCAVSPRSAGVSWFGRVGGLTRRGDRSVDAGDSLIAGRIGGRLYLVGELPDERGVIDRHAVYGCADHKLAGERGTLGRAE